VTGFFLPKTDLPYIYQWNREGRKGQPCRLLVRGKMNSILVEFADGHQMVTSVNAIRPADTQPTRSSQGVLL
jgi:hypothetical protein